MLEIRKEFLPMSRPAIGDEEIEAVVASMSPGRILSLPLFPGMADADVDSVCAAVREILAEA